MEKIYHHKFKEISPLIRELNFEATDYMILEKITDIEFREFNFLDFEKWEKGTIFSNTKQLKWRRFGDEYAILLSGENIASDKLVNYVDVNTEDSSVILWGFRTPHMEKDKSFTKSQFIEYQMPVRFSYPISSKYRVALKLKIQKNDLGQVVGYRFTGLREEA